MYSRDDLPLAPETALSKLLPASFILPRYDGSSLANVPPSIGQLLGVDSWGGPPLDADAHKSLGSDIERVVLLLLDGVGWYRLSEQLRTDEAGFMRVLERYGVLKVPLTSVSPATTCVATTTLLGDGATPSEHGMLGYTFNLPRFGLIANMLFWHPAWKQGAVQGELENWGLTPEAFLPTPSTAEVLARAGVPMRVIMPAAYSRSPLSRMRPRGAEIEGFVNATDMWMKLDTWLSETADQRAYAYAYYADFDTLSHRDGADGAFWNALWREFTFHLQHFVDGLSAAQRRKTLFLLTADHGHVVTPKKGRVTYGEHPELLELCSSMPGGEARHVYLYTRDTKAVLAYAREYLADTFVALDSAEALAAGLYGRPESLHPEARRRLGDVSLLAKGPHYFWDERDHKVLLGMHSSLESEEMLVPLIGFRFD